MVFQSRPTNRGKGAKLQPATKRGRIKVYEGGGGGAICSLLVRVRYGSNRRKRKDCAQLPLSFLYVQAVRSMEAQGGALLLHILVAQPRS